MICLIRNWDGFYLLQTPSIFCKRKLLFEEKLFAKMNYPLLAESITNYRKDQMRTTKGYELSLRVFVKI